MFPTSYCKGKKMNLSFQSIDVLNLKCKQNLADRTKVGNFQTYQKLDLYINFSSKVLKVALSMNVYKTYLKGKSGKNSIFPSLLELKMALIKWNTVALMIKSYKKLD